MKKLLFVIIAVMAVSISNIATAQNKPIINATVSGKIVDSKTNEPLVGAAVQIKGTTNGSTTDVNGDFSLITGQKLPFSVIISL
jgi:iron complex outermembrane receptor protein